MFFLRRRLASVSLIVVIIVSHTLALTQTSLGLISVGTDPMQPDQHPNEIITPDGSSAHVGSNLAMLNSEAFWWLMFALTLCIGAAVVGVEINEQSVKAVEKLPRESSRESLQDTGESYLPQDVIRFIFCVVAVNFTLLLWGIAQEFVLTTTYISSSGKLDYVPSKLFIVSCNRFIAVIFSACLLRFLGRPLWFPGFFKNSVPALTNSASSWCAYASLDYISFTLQTATKSSKLLPVVMLGSLRGKRYKVLDYAEVIVITTSLVVFGFMADENDDSDEGRYASTVGILLLLGLLMFDSVTPHLQDAIFEHHPDMDPMQAALASSAVAFVVTLAIELVNGSVLKWVHFIPTHPAVVLHLLVMSVASALSQFVILYTIKHFGPVVLTLIVTTRQIISVIVSVVLFSHTLPSIAWVAAALIFGTVVVRSLRSIIIATPEQQFWPPPSTSMVAQFVIQGGAAQSLLVCAAGIHILYAIYAVIQEYLTIHRFNGLIFEYPVFSVAVNHTTAAVFAYFAIRYQDVQLCVPGLHLTWMPAAANFVATVFQHKALYTMLFPAQTLMKTFKLIPVMLVGKLIGNRSYSYLDYIEAIFITSLVAYFVYDFQLNDEPAGEFVTQHDNTSAQTGLTIGVFLMLGYVVTDAFLPNLEDHVYQAVSITPSHMLFGMEVISAAFAWISLLATQELWGALSFLHGSKICTLLVVLMAVASAAGAYTCMLTVRLFGPAVFTLLMMSRQVLSILLSVLAFNHDVTSLQCICLVAVAILILTSSMRRVSMQVHNKAFESP